jgi:hypothetical protein
MATKSATKKTAVKKTAEKTTTTPVKAAAKKAPAKKSTVKVAAKKAATVKKAARKAAAKKTAAKKATAPKPPQGNVTTVVAKGDIGFGNELFIRGEGNGLSWDEGKRMECVASDEWRFSCTDAPTGLAFKVLINDEIWAEGEDMTVPAGGTVVFEPAFD